MKNRINCILSLLLAICVAAATMTMPALAEGNTAIEGLIEFTPTAHLYVFVDGTLDGEMSAKVESGKVVTLNAPEVSGKRFNYWAVGSENGPKASYLTSYKMAVNADTKLYAVYSGDLALEKPTGAFTAAVKTTENGSEAAIKLTATFSVAENSNVSEAGVIYTSNLLLGVAGDVDLINDPIDGIDVEQMLTSGKSNRRLRKSVAENEGLVTSYVNGKWTSDSGNWPLNQADWTLTIKAPGENVPVYAVVYETVDGETEYSDVFTAVYKELPAVSLSNSEIDDALHDKLGH